MVNQLILEFRKNNEDKKLFIFYTKASLTILLLAQAFTKYLIIKEIIAMLLIIIVMYIYICRKIKIKFFSKDIFSISKNVFNYTEYKNNGYKNFIINYLKKNNLYTKSKILFIIESIRERKNPKLTRDWITFILTVVLTLLVAAMSNGRIDYKIFENFIVQIIAIGIICLTYYIFLFHGLMNIYKITFSKQSTLNLLDDILSDIYLEMRK